MNQRIMSVFNMFNDNFGQAEVISVKATQESLPKQGLRTVSIPLPYWVEELVESGKLLKVQVEAAAAEGSMPRRAFKLCNFAPSPTFLRSVRTARVSYNWLPVLEEKPRAPL